MTFKLLLISLAIASSSLAASPFAGTSDYEERRVDSIAKTYFYFLDSLPQSDDSSIKRFQSEALQNLRVERMIVITSMGLQDFDKSLNIQDVAAGHCFDPSGRSYDIYVSQAKTTLSRGQVFADQTNRICLSSVNYLDKNRANFDKAVAAGIAQGLAIRLGGFSSVEIEKIRSYIFDKFSTSDQGGVL